MLRYILFAILFYLLYLGIRTFLGKFRGFKKIFSASGKANTKSNKYSKADLNNIEDADYEEIKKN